MTVNVGRDKDRSGAEAVGSERRPELRDFSRRTWRRNCLGGCLRDSGRDELFSDNPGFLCGWVEVLLLRQRFGVEPCPL